MAGDGRRDGAKSSFLGPTRRAGYGTRRNGLQLPAQLTWRAPPASAPRPLFPVPMTAPASKRASERLTKSHLVAHTINTTMR